MDKTSKVTTPACVCEIGRECIICGGTVEILSVVDPRTICPDCVAKIRKVIGVDNEMLPSVKLFGNSEQLDPEVHVERTETHACDLISRQAALDEKNIVHMEMFGRDFPVVPVATLKRLPPVDAVPVVKCKDCKYWKTGEGVNRSKKVKFCTYNIGHHYARRDEDFCSRGERKDGGNHG